MKCISAFFKIIDAQTIIVTLLAIVSTYICNRFEFYAPLPSSLLGIAIIFPIVFSINTAYKRREEALKYFASLKAHAVGYGVAVIYSVVLVSLDNIQEDLENPFDGVGDDDMNLDVAEQYSVLLEAE